MSFGLQGTYVRVEEIFVHKDYGSRGRMYNIALLRLSRSLKFSPKINAACLPRKGHWIPTKGNCFITGQ